MASIERLIATTRHGDLLGGLLWRVPSAGKSRTRALQEARALTSDATHYAQAQVGAHVRYGMFQPRASEEGVSLPKGVLAAAACFARQVGANSPNAALVLAVGASGQRKEERFLVVCLEDGVPVIDVLSNEVDARNALGGEDRPIWSDNPVAYPNCEAADFEWLAAGADKTARLLPIPINPWPFVAAGLALAVGVAAWTALRHVQRVERERDAQAAARAADPTPRYLAALAMRAPTMATDRAALTAAAAEMFSYPTRVPGWRLAVAECSTARQACTREWVRKGGDYDDLRNALPGDALEMLVPRGEAAPALDAARTSHPWRVPRVDLLHGAHPLRDLDAAFSVVGAQLQAWRNAEIALDLRHPALWPRLPDVPKTFRHPHALLSGEADLQNVPGPFILEALRSAPDFVSWESVKVEVGEGADPRGLLRFSASGVFYVAAH